MQVSKTSIFKKGYKRLPDKVKDDINRAISVLLSNPNNLPFELNDKKLKNSKITKKWGEIHRIKPYHTGYRLAYLYKNNTLVLIHIDTRDNFYKDLSKK